MNLKPEEVIKILDVFYFPNKTIVVLVNCKMEPMLGDFLADTKGNLIWKVDGIVLHTNRHLNEKPIYHLNNKDHLRSISISALENNPQIKVGALYHLKRH